MTWGLTRAEKSLIREVHVTGALGAHGADTQFAPRGSYEIDTSQHGQVAPVALVRRLDEGGFDVVMVPNMKRLHGPYADRARADTEAAIINLEKRAERISAAAIKRMAERAEWWHEHEEDDL